LYSSGDNRAAIEHINSLFAFTNRGQLERSCDNSEQLDPAMILAGQYDMAFSSRGTRPGDIFAPE